MLKKDSKKKDIKLNKILDSKIIKNKKLSKLKISKETKESKSKLKNKIDKLNEFIDNERFIEFLQTSIKSPINILKNNKNFQEFPNLEQEVNFIQNIDEKKPKSDNPFEYNIGIKENNEPEYISSFKKSNVPKSIDVINLGRGELFEQQKVNFINSKEAKSNFAAIEKYEIVKKYDLNKIGKGKLFEKKEVQYKPSINQ